MLSKQALFVQMFGGKKEKEGKHCCSPSCSFHFPLQLFAVMLIGNGQLLAALGTAGSQYAATVGGGHSLTETMLVAPSAVVGLECSFHRYVVFTFVSDVSISRFRAAKLVTFFDTCKFFHDFARGK